jgi:hypothetical protein
MSSNTFITTATATYATGNVVAVTSTANMIPGLPISFSGNVFGGITSNATYYIGTITPGYPTSNITLSTLPGGYGYAVSNASGTMTATFSQGGQQIVPTVAPGEPLNQAFNAVNVNFDQVWAAGPVGSNVRISGNTILTLNTNDNLVLNPNGIGTVIANAHVTPDQNGIRNLGSSSLRWNTVYAQYADVAGDLSVGGNLSVAGNVIEVGNIVTDSKTIHLANSATTDNAANGSGLVVGLASNIATFLYQANINSWTTNIPFAYANGQPIGSGVIQSNTAPVSPTNQTLWWDPVTGSLYLWYTDNSGSQWVPASPTGVDWTMVGSNIIPSQNIVYGLGNATNQWASAHIGNVTANAITLKNTDDFAQIVFSSDGGSTNNGQIKVDGGTNMVVSSNNNFYVKRAGQDRIAVTDTTADFMAATNVIIQSNKIGTANIWNFDTTGNLTLPTNSSNINYANGISILNGIGGNYGDSNVVTLLGAFGSNNISTTGGITGGQFDVGANLYLGPGPGGGSFIVSNVDTSLAALSHGANGTAFIGWQEVLFNNGNIATITFNPNGNGQGTMAVSTGPTSSQYTWTFDNAGNLTLPGAVNYQVVGLGGNGHFDINSWYPVNISTGDGVNDAVSTWNFGYNGTLTLPGNILMNPGDSVVFNAGTSNAYIAQTMGLTIAGEGGINLVVNDGAGDFNTVGIDVYGNVQTPGSITASSISTSGNVATPLLNLGNTVAGPAAGGAGDKITIYDFYNPSQFNYAIGAESSNLWFGVDQVESGVGFNFYGGNTLAMHIDSTGNVISPNFVGNLVSQYGTIQSGILGNGLSMNANIDAGQEFLGMFVGNAFNPYQSLLVVDQSSAQLAVAGHNWDFDNTGNLTIPKNIIGSGSVGITPNISAPNFTWQFTESGGLLSTLQAPLSTSNVTSAIKFPGDAGNGFVYWSNATPFYNTMVVSSSANLTFASGSSNVGMTFAPTGNLTVPGNISTGGNVTGNYFIGNGSQLTGLPATYGNSNVVTLLSAYGSNTVSTTGNISAGNVITSGALQGGTGTQGITMQPWTGGGSYAALYSTAITPGNGNYSMLVNGTNTWLNAATGGSLFFRINNNSTPTAFTVTGTQATVGSIGTANATAYATQTLAVAGGGLGVVGNSYFSNTVGIGGNVSVAGNVTAQNFIGNISITGDVFGTSSNVQLVAGSYTWTFDNTGNLTIPAGGDILLANTQSIISAAGNITGGNLLTGGLISATGNITASGTAGVITPNRPAFRVYGNGVTTALNTTTNGTGILNGNNWAVDYNQGSYLNSTTGVFTAPVAGLYQVNLVARCANNTGPASQVVVIKNYGSGNINQVFWEIAANTTTNHFGVSTVSKLAVNDTLTLKVTQGNITFDVNDNWSVAFLG